MNNEPIQFLPVNRFWDKPKPISTGNALLLGFTAGLCFGTALFVITAFLICK